MSQTTLAKIIILAGFVLIAIGGLIYVFNRTGIQLGNLPGDIRLERENFSCVLALGTSLVLSILLTIGINLILRLINH